MAEPLVYRLPSGTKYHWTKPWTPLVSSCSVRPVLTDAGRPASKVPGPARCMRDGCATQWGAS